MPNLKRNREGRKILLYRVTLQSTNSTISISAKNNRVYKGTSLSRGRDRTWLKGT